MTINRAEFESTVSSVLNQDKSAPYTIEIVIYGISSGKEIYSYSGTPQKDISVQTQRGKIEALIKIKKNNYLHSVLFLEAEGSDKNQIYLELARKIKKALCN